MKKAALLIPVVLIAFVISMYFGRRDAPYQPPAVLSADQPASGEHIFQRNCSFCHGARGQGSERGPSLLDDRNGAALTDFMVRSGRMPIADVAQRMRRAAPVFAPAAIKVLDEYVASLGGKGPAVPTPGAGDVVQGEQLYQVNCAACHSGLGGGGVLQPAINSSRIGSGPRIPALYSSSPLIINEAIRTGPGAMPVFGPNALSDTQVNSIITYIQVLQRRHNPGGADLGRFGPVAEGAIAWLIGIGALLLISRWIGRSRDDDTEHAHET